MNVPYDSTDDDSVGLVGSAALTSTFCVFPLVLTGGTGDKDRAPISHESFLLMANSQTDMDDWVKAIRRVIWAPFGGGKAKPLNTHIVFTQGKVRFNLIDAGS